MYGPWTYYGNPCRGVNPQNGLGDSKTFGGQSTFVLPVDTDEGTEFIAMFDIWRPENAIDGRYVWLPIRLRPSRMIIEWQDEWKPRVKLR